MEPGSSCTHEGRQRGAVGLTSDRLECGPYARGIPGMYLGLAELTNLKTVRAEEDKEETIKVVQQREFALKPAHSSLLVSLCQATTTEAKS